MQNCAPSSNRMKIVMTKMGLWRQEEKAKEDDWRGVVLASSTMASLGGRCGGGEEEWMEERGEWG